MVSTILIPVFGVVLLGVLSILFTYVRTGAPPVPSERREIGEVITLLRRAGLPASPKIYELGSGWGALALALAGAFPEARVVGIELSPLPWLIARWRARGVTNLEIRWADFHRVDLEDADAVAAYLMITPMVPLAQTLDRRLQPGTPVVTVTFWFRDRRPSATLRGSSGRGGVALYRWPARGSVAGSR